MDFDFLNIWICGVTRYLYVLLFWWLDFIVVTVLIYKVMIGMKFYKCFTLFWLLFVISWIIKVQYLYRIGLRLVVFSIMITIVYYDGGWLYCLVTLFLIVVRLDRLFMLSLFYVYFVAMEYWYPVIFLELLRISIGYLLVVWSLKT